MTSYATRRELDACARKAGATLVDVRHGGKHIRATVERNGKRATVFCSLTPSDWRVWRKIEGDMRRATE